MSPCYERETQCRFATAADLADCRRLIADPPEREYRELRNYREHAIGRAYRQLVLC